MVPNVAGIFARCRNDRCASRLPYVHLRHNGLTLNDTWVCGVECLEEQLSQLFHHSGTPGRRSEPVRSRLPLGLALLSRGFISPDALRAALRMQQECPEVRVGDILRNMGAVNDSQITAARATQWRCPVFPLNEKSLRLNVNDFIPAALLWKHSMLPVHFAEQNRSLYLAFGCEVHYPVIRAIERALGATVVPCMVDDMPLQESLSALAPENEVLLPSITSPEDITRITVGYAETLRASSIRTASVGNDIWIRLHGRQRVDLIFGSDRLIGETRNVEPPESSALLN